MNQKYNRGYDVIRVIAIIAVVIIHCNSAFLWETDANATSALFILELTALCVASVPLFFMVSGALLLDVEESISLRELFIKRIKKQTIPFVSWSLLYVMARIVVGKAELKLITFFSLLYEPAYAQFWFMYTLLSIYLLLPILQVLVINITKKQFQYLLIIWGIFSSLVPVLTAYIPFFSISNHVDLILCEGYVGYFLIGYYLKKYGKSISCKIGVWLVGSGILITALMVYLEWVLLERDMAIHVGLAYGNYLFPGAVLVSIGTFVFWQNRVWKREGFFQTKIVRLSSKTVGVYYVHMFIVTFFEWTIWRNSVGVGVTLLKSFLTVLLSFLVTSLLEYIPVVSLLLLGKGNIGCASKK